MSALSWKQLSEIEARPIIFADKPIWQQSAFHLLVGRKNSGKGTLLAADAARVTRGELGDHRNVMWVATGEDSYAIDIRPRIEVAGGDLARVTVLDQGRLILPDHVNDLKAKAREIGDVGMIVLDPLSGNLGRGRNSNHDSDVRPALSSLNDLADRLGCLIAGVRHLTNKEIRGGILSGVLGSSDWVNVPRVVLALIHDPEQDDLRHLSVSTGNRVRANVGRLYRIEGAPSPVDGGEDVTRAVHIGDSLRAADDLLDVENGRPDSKTTRARDVLLDALETAPAMRMESDELDALVASETGLAARSVRNLRAKLKHDGLVQPIPEKDEHGTVTRWLVARTGAPRA